MGGGCFSSRGRTGGVGGGGCGFGLAGSRAVIPPAIQESGVHYHTSDTIMRITELPEHLVIVGGGFIAAEFAHVFSALGVRITLVIRGGRMLQNYDDAICERFTRIASSKWELRTQRNIVGAADRDSGVSLELDDGSTLDADLLLVATGRVSNADQLDAEQAGVEVKDGSHTRYGEVTSVSVL